MSEPVRVALVVEGPTDSVVIEAAIARVLGGRPFVPVLLQPEGSLAFGQHGGGWGGVYRWCRQTAERNGGRLAGDVVFDSYDILVIHLDADVAAERYSDANVQVIFHDLPCERPCPPPESTTNALRRVLL
ncbi:MAG: hypothetical protein ACREAC_01035, partial [Blastocatellia bacterium]